MFVIINSVILNIPMRVYNLVGNVEHGNERIYFSIRLAIFMLNFEHFN